MITALLPPLWLIHVAVAAVWFYEGLWCKLLNGQPRQVRVVEAMPLYGAAYCVEAASSCWESLRRRSAFGS